MTRSSAQVGLILLTALILFLTIPLAVRPVTATDNQKWFVCKYVGTPGVDERLQSGDNPISVGNGGVPQPVPVGQFFQDSQGRSFILAEDTGQPEPDPSDCPPPDTGGSPTPSPTASPTPTPSATASATPTASPTATPTPSATATPSLPSIEPFRVITCPVTGLPIPVGQSAIEFQHPLLLLILLHIKIDGIERTPTPVETVGISGGGAVAALNSVEFIVSPGLHDWSIEDDEGTVLASGTVDCPVCNAAPASPPASTPPDVPDTALPAPVGSAIGFGVLLLGLLLLAGVNVLFSRRR